MAFWVYMLECADGSYYVGHTDDLGRRVASHQGGEVKGYTSKRKPVVLVFSERFTTRDEALACERQVKGWSRAKKQALVRGDLKEISRLARGRDAGTP